MTADKTQGDGNRIIAEFMGYQIKEWSYPDKSKGVLYHTGKQDYQNMDWANDWSLLMPVVEKIWKTNKMISLNLYTEGGGTVNCKIYNWVLGDPYQESENKEPIVAVWETVIQFIKWYNTNSK